MAERFDDVVAGAGVLGLAVAYQLARRGRSVLVCERSEKAQGASVRNFGMIWPIGQPTGPLYDLAMASRGHWLTLVRSAGLWHDPVGSLQLAYHDDEEQVVREFAGRAVAEGRPVELLDPAKVLERSPYVNPSGLKLGLFSPTEVCVDPREVIAGLPEWLGRAHGVRFRFGTAVKGYDRPEVSTTAGAILSDRLWVCAGDDFQTLYPEAFAGQRLFRCKLQMMRGELTQRDGARRFGPMLAGGLTLRHYKSFEGCPTLPALRERVARESPEFDRFGIHVMACQNGRGEVVLGDSHEYDDPSEPFDKAGIDALILGYLATFLTADFSITARWHGTYAKHPSLAFLTVRPAPGVTALAATGGAGMTLSHGLADSTVTSEIGPAPDGA